MDFRYFINKFDRTDSFFVLDPTYPEETRTAGNYKYELSARDHRDLLNLCTNLKGKFLLHTYPNKLYQDYIDKNKWNTKTFEYVKSSSSSKTKPKAKELVITNYKYED
jgi:DNA adenine methylase